MNYIRHGKKEARKINRSHKIVSPIRKVKNFIYPVYNYFPFLKKLNKKIKDKNFEILKYK